MLMLYIILYNIYIIIIDRKNTQILENESEYFWVIRSLSYNPYLLYTRGYHNVYKTLFDEYLQHLLPVIVLRRRGDRHYIL